MKIFMLFYHCIYIYIIYGDFLYDYSKNLDKKLQILSSHNIKFKKNALLLYINVDPTNLTKLLR